MRLVAITDIYVGGHVYVSYRDKKQRMSFPKIQPISIPKFIQIGSAVQTDRQRYFRINNSKYG